MSPQLHRAILAILTAILGLCLATASCRAAGEAKTDTLALGIAAVVRDEIAAGHIPGAVVLVGEGGKTIYRQAFGRQAIQPAPKPMRADTIFDLASLTKVVATTTAVMQLVEAHRLGLGDPVAKYWPDFAQGGKDAITIEQLLTHTSGLRPDLDLAGDWSGETEALARIAAEQPVEPPGSKFLYSDLNFIVLGDLVRRISGERLDAYARRHIFRPLGMADTGFLPSPGRRGRIAPTDLQQGSLRWGDVQDPTAARMGGVAGHAGLFGTANDLAIFARMLLGNGTIRGVRILRPASVLAMTLPRRLGDEVVHGLGWDIASPYSGGQDVAFGPESFGHTGYSGTSLWIDPKRGTYLVILTSRLHPDDKGDARPLRQRLAELVAATLPPQVLTGIDVLEAEGFRQLAGQRIGLLTNQTGRDASGRRSIDLLATAESVKLERIFSPEHGIAGNGEGAITSGKDQTTGLPITSLYGADLHPSMAMLSGLDALVIDLQDVGVRFYTYPATMAYAMEAAAKAGIAVYVLDRPNPLTGAVVEGPMLDPQPPSLTSYFPMPVRHGMTMGELAAMFNAENRIGSTLTVIPLRDYRRALWYDETGLAWINPSPNLHSLKEAILYGGVALVEGANVSVGRGTARPFERVGAPWIDGALLTRALQARNIPGVRFTAGRFTPSADPYTGQSCGGVRIELTDRNAFNAPRLGIELAAALDRLYPGRFKIERILDMVGSRRTLDAIEQGADPKQIAEGWNTDIADFASLRAKYLLYP